jgi:hypothetical protein
MKKINRFLFLAVLFSSLNAAVPTWRQAMVKGQWNVIPAATLQNSGAAYTTHGTGNCGSCNVIRDWGGGILATRGLYVGSTFTAGNFLVVYGGGHTDYGGNEVLAFGSLDNNSPAWNRLRDSTAPHPVNVDTNATGDPVSRHVYNSLVYVPDSAKMYMMGAGFRFTDAAASPPLITYNFNQTSPNSNKPWGHKTAVTATFGDVAAYDPVLNRIWYHDNTAAGGGNVAYHDVSANTNTSGSFRSPLLSLGNPMSAMDSSLGLWGMWDRANGLGFFRNNGGVTNDYYRPTTTGNKPCRHSGSGASNNEGTMAFDKSRNAFVFWLARDSACSVQDRRNLFILTPPATSPYAGGNAWVWTRETPSGTTPTVAVTNSTFGRFQYVDAVDIRGYILQNDWTDSVYFYLDSSATTYSASTPSSFELMEGF